MNKSIPLPGVEILNLSDSSLSPLISKCQIKVCWVGDEPNRNRSVITKEVAKQMAQSLRGAAIVGLYDEIKEDFEEHSRSIELSNGEFKIKDITKPYGFVPTDAKVWFQKYRDFDEVDREYLVTEGYLWTGQYPECNRIITEGNNQSMELDPNLINAEWSKDNNGNPQFFIINEAIISKLCILGNDCEPCFEGANITDIQFSLSDDFKEQLFSMINKVEELLSEGGNDMADEIIETEVTVEDEVTEVEFAATEENVEEIKDKTEESEALENDITTEDSIEEELVVENEYSLDDIPEYQDLLAKFSELESKYNDLLTEMDNLKNDNAELSEFKKITERAQKMDMINNEFSMLDEADKAGVIEKIDEYSLSEIKKELSVICFDNKINFSKETKEVEVPATTFSLDANFTVASTPNVPDWVSAVMEVQKEI